MQSQEFRVVFNLPQDTTISYDYESRITSVSGPGMSLSHTYNGLDTRVTTTQNSVSRTFKRDGAYVTDPVLSDGAASYTPSASERRGITTTFLHSGLKNADAQTSAAGSVSGTRVYDAFGAELSSTGSWQGAFGYAGGFGYQEDANGFKLLGHRYYDPSTGRFLTRDPAKDGRNWYSYCDSNPVRRVDPTGLIAFMPANEATPTRRYPETDKFGNRLRPGAWWLLPNYYLTLPDADGFATIHFRSRGELGTYLRDPKGQAHEPAHNIQGQNLGLGGNHTIWIALFASQYILFLGHDRAPFEQEADQLAWLLVETGTDGVLANLIRTRVPNASSSSKQANEVIISDHVERHSGGFRRGGTYTYD